MSKKESSLLIVQPILTNYRVPVFDGLARKFASATVVSRIEDADGFGDVVGGSFSKIHSKSISLFPGTYYQIGVLPFFIKRKPDVVLITADFRALSFWVLLITNLFYGKSIIAFGQGLFRKQAKGSSRAYILLFKIMIALVTKYVCYAEYLREDLIRAGINDRKLRVVQNSLYNPCPVAPDEKPPAHGILYLGRLRPGSNVDLLFDAVEHLRSVHGVSIPIHIIGGGELLEALRASAKRRQLDVSFHGELYDPAEISSLSKQCSLGVYPGDAGLSVVHFMSLSLAPIVHAETYLHMGPEPAYVDHLNRGLTFSRNSMRDLAEKILFCIENPGKMEKFSKNAYKFYQELNSVRMEDKFYEIMAEDL